MASFIFCRVVDSCIEPMSSQCWCMVRKQGHSQRLLLDDWMPLVTPKNPSDPIYSTFYQHLSGTLTTILQFPFLLKQAGSISLVVWNIQIQGNITIELSVCSFNHQATGGDLEAALAAYRQHSDTTLGACRWRRSSWPQFCFTLEKWKQLITAVWSYSLMVGW